MDKSNDNQKTKKQLTPIGRFVMWADKIKIDANPRIVGLSLLIFMASFILGQQKAHWSMFRLDVETPKVLPNFAPKKEIMANAALGCRLHDLPSIVGDYSAEQFAIKKNIEKLIGDKPMRSMIASVAQRDTQTAAYLVAIAKKESNLGKISPKDEEGKDCYNYWGYRGKENTTESGYSCFDSPQQAVEVVGSRIQYLAQVSKFDTPSKMSVWKCGFDCSWDNPQAVKKWISDVGYYYDQLNAF